MKKLRVNMCFNEVDNLEVIRLIEQSGISRPSGLIHDLVRKGLLFEKLLSGQLLQNLGALQSGHVAVPVEPVQAEVRSKAPHSATTAPAVSIAKPEPKVEPVKVEVAPEPVKPAVPATTVVPAATQSVESGSAAVMDLSSLGDLGCDFD